jgi:Uma2 family endonuclease
MQTTLRWTSADLDSLPDDGKKYEVIDGELHVSRAPHYHHQYTRDSVVTFLRNWNQQTNAGRAVSEPGIIFDDDDDVIPDVIWISLERLAATYGPDGKFHAAPELVVEVLSPGSANAHRDREAKLKLYSRRGVQEYWIIDWMLKQVEVYRRRDRALELAETLFKNDTLQSPLLPGFSCQVADLFDELPVAPPSLP